MPALPLDQFIQSDRKVPDPLSCRVVDGVYNRRRCSRDSNLSHSLRPYFTYSRRVCSSPCLHELVECRSLVDSVVTNRCQFAVTGPGQAYRLVHVAPESQRTEHLFLFQHQLYCSQQPSPQSSAALVRQHGCSVTRAVSNIAPGLTRRFSPQSFTSEDSRPVWRTYPRPGPSHSL
jgi:hypothetical protein